MIYILNEMDRGQSDERVSSNKDNLYTEGGQVVDSAKEKSAKEKNAKEQVIKNSKESSNKKKKSMQGSQLKVKKEAHVVVSAYKKNINSTPQKTLLLSKLIQSKKFEYVKQQLEFSDKKVSSDFLSLLVSCERRVPQEDFNKLYVRIHVSKGYVVKRRRCRARGSSSSIFHRKAHLTVSLIKYKMKRGL